MSQANRNGFIVIAPTRDYTQGIATTRNCTHQELHPPGIVPTRNCTGKHGLSSKQRREYATNAGEEKKNRTAHNYTMFQIYNIRVLFLVDGSVTYVFTIFYAE